MVSEVEDIRHAVVELLAIVRRLHLAYPVKRFTLDGRLVGDLGEILAQSEYELTVYERMPKHHDAETPDGRRVQIKATMKDALTFPADHVPDYYLGLRIDEHGRIEEIFNGPGWVAAQTVAKRRTPKTNLHSISLTALRALNAKVTAGDRVARRSRGECRSTNT